jgi:capsular exopolysaccharide synthesis family protein
MSTPNDLRIVRDPKERGTDAGAGVKHVVDLARRHRLALAGCGLLGLAAALGWLGKEEPVYRAKATVLIDEQDGPSATLSELSLFGSAPRASAEIALLSSRALAENVVAAPRSAEASLAERHLALAAEVDALDRRPLSSIVARLFGRSPAPRVEARLVASAPGAPERVRLDFLDDGQVEIATIPALPYGERLRSDVHVVPFTNGGTIEHQGLVLELSCPDGATPRGTHLVHVRSEDAAARDLLGSTRVMETQRNSGVLELTVSDSDPWRAAAKANALCLNYFDLKVERSRRRAAQSIEFIESQLEEQTGALTRAEEEVVELRRTHPDLIDLSSSAGRIVAQLSAFEVDRLRIELAQRSLDEAIALAEAGDDRGLSQLSSELSDPLSNGLVERLETLGLERHAATRADGGPYRTLLQQRAAELDERAAEARLELEALEQVIASARAGEAGAFARLSSGAAGGAGVDPLTLGYLNELGRLEGERELLAATYQEIHRERARVETAIVELRQRILANLESRAAALAALVEERTGLAAAARDVADAQVTRDVSAIDEAVAATRTRIAQHLATRRDAAQRQIDELGAVCAELEAELGRLPEMERLLAGPLRRLETHKELTALLLKSLQEAQITHASALAAADFVDRAAVPTRRFAPRLSFTLALGVLAGLVVGIAGLLLREHLQESLDSEADLESATGLPVLASVPDFRSGPQRVSGAGDAFVAMRDDPAGPIAEAYRSLRASLRFAVGDLASLRTIAVTSSAPSEGKSTTNVDLAWCLAAPSRRVLLVDADLRRPSVHRYLGVAAGPGLSECLVGNGDWRSCVQASGRDHLDVLAAGRSDRVSADLLGSDAMGQLLDEWLGTYDLVVFDLPPALVVADVETFAHRLDAVLLLYRAGGLPAHAVENTAKRLRSAGAKLVGLVMNACRPDRTRGAGAYGDYYKARTAYFEAGDTQRRAS